jgi:hypothetical protein
MDAVHIELQTTVRAAIPEGHCRNSTSHCANFVPVSPATEPEAVTGPDVDR